MRLQIAKRLSPVQKVFAFIVRSLVGQLPGPIQVMSYRKRLFGLQMNVCFSEAMRGPSDWTAGERELMAAVLSKKLQCAY